MRVGDSLLAAAKTPLWIAAIATGAKSFVDNPILGSETLNRWGLHVGRMRLAAFLAGFRRRRLARRVPLAQRQAFERDGFVVMPDFLPASIFGRLQAEVLDDAWDAREMRQGGTVTRRVLLDEARLGKTKPALAEFLGRQDMRSLIRYAAATGGEPTFSIQCILAGEAGAADDPQCVVHADTFHATAKAWFFLHDVGPDDGPFLYVPGSHAVTPQRLAWEREQSVAARRNARRDHAEGSFRISVAELRRLGLPEPRPVAVRANTLVIADTFGFHGRTPSPKPTRRIEIYGTLRRNPFLPWTGLDPLSLPVLRTRQASLLTVLDRLGIVPMPWRPVGQIHLDAPPRI